MWFNYSVANAVVT